MQKERAVELNAAELDALWAAICEKLATYSWRDVPGWALAGVG
jgi:hypothetical protein